MKKSLYLVFAFALVFSLFSSVAFAASSSTTTSSSLTLQEKMQALGFTGTDHKNLDRADAAVSILKGLGISVDNSAPLPFVDVSKSQAWGPYIATAYKLGIIHGEDATHYAPYKTISQEDYTIELVLAYAAQTGTQIDTSATADVKADGYAKAYIKAATDLGLVGSSADWTTDAAYDWMVDGAYNAKQAVAKANNPAPAKVSVTSAKAVGVQTVEVDLNKAVDTTKATFTLTKDGSNVALDSTKTTWSDDKMTATLTLDGSTKIAAGNYTVTLGGLDASAIDQASASFTGQDETVQKIEFVTPNDQIPTATDVRIQFKALNQYGEEASFSAADFSDSVPSGYSDSIKKDSNGNLYLELNTAAATIGATPVATSGQTQIPVYVYYNDNHVTAQKTFKLEFAPFVSTIKVGDVSYSEGTSLANTGDTATAPITFYDQYGYPVLPGDKAVSSGAISSTDIIDTTSVNTNFTPYPVETSGTVALNASVQSNDANDGYVVKISLNDKLDASKQYTLNLYEGSATAKVPFEVTAGKLATKIKFGGVVDGATLASGDTNKYVTIEAWDASGGQLSASDIADTANISRISVTANGATLDPTYTDGIVTAGSHKGQIKLSSITASKDGYVFLTASVLSQNANSYDTIQIPVQAARVPDSITLATKNDLEGLKYGANAGTSDFGFNVLDQYGDKMSGAIPTGYSVGFTVTGATYATITSKDGSAAVTDGSDLHALAAAQAKSGLDFLNDNFTFAATNNYGKTVITATLKKGTQTLSSATTSMTSIDPSSAHLNYALNSVDPLYNTIDDGRAYGANIAAAYSTIDTSTLNEQVSDTVTDNNGDTVAIPDNVIALTSSNTNVAQTVAGSTYGNKGYVLGDKAGTATLNALIQKFDGTTTNLSTDVTVKSDLIAVKTISSDDSDTIGTAATVGGTTTYTGVTNADLRGAMGLDIYDNYGNEYNSQAQMQAYNKLLGVTYAVSDVTNATVTIDQQNHAITVTPTNNTKPYQFVVTATAPNGLNTATLFTNP